MGLLSKDLFVSRAVLRPPDFFRQTESDSAGKLDHERAATMTEAEWLECADPTPMLAFLRGKASDRKQRLFAVACSRRIWHLIDTLGRAAVEAAEKFADGLVESTDMRAARLACQGAGGQAAWYPAATNPEIAARNTACSAQAGVASNAMLDSEAAERLAQAKFLRDIFGNPFRPITLDCSWLTPEVVRLAQKIYADRIFERLPLLADELANAGCVNAEILRHCRGPGPHVRGCWVVDLVLGKH
jgi:hypothetical protein